jgi:lipopolysaccharide/colanic/teichoic acid biosynthesis glycosyltransferase
MDKMLKRAFDITVSAVGLAVFALPLAGITLALKKYLMPKKLTVDLEYERHRTLWSDLMPCQLCFHSLTGYYPSETIKSDQTECAMNKKYIVRLSERNDDNNIL